MQPDLAPRRREPQTSVRRRSAWPNTGPSIAQAPRLFLEILNDFLEATGVASSLRHVRRRYPATGIRQRLSNRSATVTPLVLFFSPPMMASNMAESTT